MKLQKHIMNSHDLCKLLWKSRTMYNYIMKMFNEALLGI